LEVASWVVELDLLEVASWVVGLEVASWVVEWDLLERASVCESTMPSDGKKSLVKL
jgi:hypothetical protein